MVTAPDRARPDSSAPGRPSRGRQPRRRRDPRIGYLLPRRCEMYVPGHTVHWIQAHRSAGLPHRTGRLTAVEDDVITVDFGGEVTKYRNCDPERLLEIVGIGRTVGVCERYWILKSSSGYVFSVAPADAPWQVPCDFSPLPSATPEALAERLETHGGFSVPGRRLVEALAGEAVADEARADEDDLPQSSSL